MKSAAPGSAILDQKAPGIVHACAETRARRSLARVHAIKICSRRQFGRASRMRNHKERVVPHCRQRRRASRSRTPSSVTATCSFTSCRPSQRGHGTDSACVSITAALCTTTGRPGVPPASSSNKRCRAACNLSSERAASLSLVRGRDFLAIPTE